MNPAEFDRTFKLPFAEAVAWFRAKVNVPTERWDELEGAAHAKAFTSAGAVQADLLGDLRKMTDAAIAGGMDIREFRKQFKPLLGKYGWQLKGGGPGWRSDLIWRTNIQNAYQAGRWQQFEEAGITHLKYLHNDSVRHPRPKHVAMDGTVLPLNDPFWMGNYPPNGFGCKCRAVPATKAEISSSGKNQKRPEGWQDKPDTGWNYNVGDNQRGYRALTAKFESMPNDLARQWMQRFVREPAFARFVAGEIKEDFPVAVLQPEDMEALGAAQQTVWMSPETLQEHLQKHSEVTLEDYRKIPALLDTGEVYRQTDTRLVVLWRDEKLYRAALKRTGDGKDNYFLTLFTTSKAAADREVRSKYVRVR